jgi:hypothetical protein
MTQTAFATAEAPAKVDRQVPVAFVGVPEHRGGIIMGAAPVLDGYDGCRSQL